MPQKFINVDPGPQICSDCSYTGVFGPGETTMVRLMTRESIVHISILESVSVTFHCCDKTPRPRQLIQELI